jgi:hypothetical protein
MSPGGPGRAVVPCIEPPMASRPFGLPSLTPPVFTAFTACAHRVPWRGGEAGEEGGLLFPSSLHGVLTVKVCAHVVRLRPSAVCEP